MNTRPFYPPFAGEVREVNQMVEKKVVDYAEQKHWDLIYESSRTSQNLEPWRPISYPDRVLDYALSTHIEKYKPRTVLEIGCGNSKWLGYLAKRHRVIPAGIDYSPEGCNLAKERLNIEKVEGEIFCFDILDNTIEMEKKYDFIFSLGVIEHFDDTAAILNSFLTHLSPNGVLLTCIPNLRSIHGLLCWIWQPDLLAKHVILTKKQLVKAYQKCELHSIESYYGGIFTLSLIAWDIYPRWPRVAKYLLPAILQIRMWINNLMNKIPYYRGISLFSPYIVISGIKEN